MLGIINLYGLDLQYVIDGESGAINFTAIFELVMSDIGEGILNDFDLPDNELIIGENEEE